VSLAAAPAPAGTLVELGLVFLGLGILARLAGWVAVSPIPLYLLAGLVIGSGRVPPLRLSEEFITTAAELGVLLLLFALGLEYSGDELSGALRSQFPAGLLDAALNFTPGFAAGVALGWSALSAALLGGVTYISSSGVISKLLTDLGRLGNRETPSVLGILVIEDLAMAVYLPVVSVLLLGEDMEDAGLAVLLALGAVVAFLALALRYGERVSEAFHSRSDEVLLLMTVGVVLLVGGVAIRLQVSAAIGAFLVGIGLSGPARDRAAELVEPLRTLFAATFFLFFGLQIDAADLVPVVGVAAALGSVTAVTKVGVGWWAAAREGISTRGRVRAGTALVARGEFSIVIAGLAAGAAGVDPDLGPTAAAYVLFTAVAGPILTRFADPLADRLVTRRAA
jgi:CPA2 family monovalent cation:H+ antiporter-2